MNEVSSANGMAYQASDQSWRESRVSRQEVASPCGGGVSLGRILWRCVRVTSALEKAVDGVAEDEVRSE